MLKLDNLIKDLKKNISNYEINHKENFNIK